MRTKLKKLFALLLIFTCMLTMFTSCSNLSLASLLGIEEEEDDTVEDMEMATPGGEDIVLPENFAMPETANSLVGVIVEGTDTYVGTIYLSTYKADSYLFINGNSLTIDANFYLTDANGESVDADPGYRDVKVALWEKGENQAEHIVTAHFDADGTNQTYTFTNLTQGGEYRISITYTDWWAYNVNGNFRLSSISATGSEEETLADE